MKRVTLKSGDRERFFEKAMRAVGGWNQAARICEVSNRTVKNWSRGAHQPPLHAIAQLSRRSKTPFPLIEKIEEEGDIKRKAGRRGALARITLYGNPGTPDGRRKGGLKAIARMRKMKTRFRFRKKINKPKLNRSLAELVGIILGDGSITKHQIRITLNSKTDAEYARFVSNLFKGLFDIEAPILRHSGDLSVVNVTVSSTALVEHLNRKYGLPKGNKIQKGVDIPSMIKERQGLLRACVRGLFDTDGCIYLDTHHSTKKTYRHLGLAFTSYSRPLLHSVVVALQNWGFHPTIGRMHHLLLRRGHEIVRYFREVGTNNPKHRKRFERFAKVSGGVPKWS